MTERINIEDAIEKKNVTWFDVRSPQEYKQSTIPNAINIPIFNDEERKIIGTMYHQIGTDQATDLGVEIASSKLPDLVKQFKHHSVDREMIVFCWRGGMRSQSLVAVLRALGLPVYQLVGGYKRYRKYIVQQLTLNHVKAKFISIHGFTGSGKTLLLHQLKQLDVPMIDLEGLANHRGSVFGDLFLGEQPSQKMFEALLMEEINKYKDEKWIVIENESKRIGKIWIPNDVYLTMKEGKHIFLSVTLDTRAKRILEEYYRDNLLDDVEFYTERLKRITKWIGKAKAKEIIEHLSNNRMDKATKIMLADYYDPLYDHGDKKYDQFDYYVDGEDLLKAAELIKSYIAQND